MKKIYINESNYLEFISDIATQITEIVFEHDTYIISSKEDQEDVAMFQEKAQDYFNEKYDEIEHMLNKTTNIYSGHY